MSNKKYPVLHWSKPNLQSIDLSRYTARIRLFVYNYALPTIATALLLLLVVFGMYIRNSEHIAIATILNSLDSQGNSFGSLISNDKTSDLTVANDTDRTPTTGQTSSSTSTTGTFSVNTNSNTGNGSSGGGVVLLPFTATIASFDQGSVTLQCSKPKPKALWCSKKYAFSSGVNTQNGPGTVSYGWRSNLPTAIENGSFSAGSGDVLTTLQKTITLACATPITFTLQFVILSPGSMQSGVKTINHNCNGI